MLRKTKKTRKIGRGRRDRNINVTLNDPFTLTYSHTYSTYSQTGVFFVHHKKYEGSQKKKTKQFSACIHSRNYTHTHMSQHTRTSTCFNTRAHMRMVSAHPV